MQTKSLTSNRLFRIAVIPGDVIGKEVTAEAVKVIEAVGQKCGRTFELEHLPWSADYFLQSGVTLPPNGYDQLREFDAIFIGALGDPRVPDNRSAQGTRAGRRELRRVQGEHRRTLRRRRRTLQSRHRR